MNGRSKRQYQVELAKITPDGRIDPAASSAKTKLSFACSEDEMASFEHLRGLLVTQGRLAGSGSEDIFSLMVEMCLDQVDPLRRAERAAARQAQKKAAAARASAAAQAPDEALVPGPDLSTPPRRYVPAAVRHEVVQPRSRAVPSLWGTRGVAAVLVWGWSWIITRCCFVAEVATRLEIWS